VLSAHDIITLLSIRGVGRRTVHRAIGVTQSVTGPTNLVELLNLVKKQGGRVALPDDATVTEAGEAASRLIASAQSERMSILTGDDDRFPKRLRGIPDAPVVLFAKGQVDVLNRAECLAIVGTRHPTPYGTEVATRVGRHAAERGFVVASGLAEGIDAAAHKGCLSARGATVAVLAHGLDRIYPANHEDLAHEIVESGGCLVSEYPPTTGVRRNQFVERNRLQSGVSQCVIVVETDVNGGTMHTARFAKEQGRAVACVRHSEAHSDMPQTQGNRKLLADSGTTALASTEDMDKLLGRLSGEPEAEVGIQLELFQ
jgi:DNA processing protein